MPSISTQSFRVWALFLAVFMLASCGGGGGSSSPGGSDNGGGSSVDSVFINWQEKAVAIAGQVVLPAGSPIELSSVVVDIYDSQQSPDENGALELKVPDKQVVEAYIMLPERDGDSLPTIYQYTTILPGETGVQLSSEETALSLLISRINQDLLLSAGTPAEVKQALRDNAAPFITQFVIDQETNPYLLNPEYYQDLYTPQFEAAAESCRTALIAASASSATQKPMLFGGSQLYVRPQQTQYDFTVYENTTGLLGIGSWLDLEDAGGVMTGDLKVENDTMLFAHLLVTDLLTGSAIQALSFDDSIHGTISAAFHPDLLGPQKGWNRLWWASTTKIDVGYKSTKVVVYTPKIAASDDATDLEKRAGAGLAFRTGANALMSVVSNFVPLDENGWKHWFVEMYDRGLLNAALDKFAYGDIQGGVEELFWTFSDGVVMEAFIKDYLAKYAKEQLASKKIVAQFMNKFNQVTKTVPIGKIGLAIDIIKLVDDAVLTPGKITFERAEFPFNLSDTAPSVIEKVAANDPLPIITITGMGLDPVHFDGETYLPSVFIEAENSKGKPIVMTIPEEELSFAGGGQSLSFELPIDWAEIGSDVVGPLYLNVAHRFIDTHGVDELVYLELPHAEHKSRFALSLDTNVVITGLSKNKPVRGEEITLFGQGFSPLPSQNSVYFTDHLGLTLAARVEIATNTLLDVVVPEGLAFGPLTVEVELYDGSESNQFPLSLHPKAVVAKPADKTHFDSTLSVSLTQDEGEEIFYALNSGDETSYSGPISLSDTTTVYPYASVMVDGVAYKSAVNSYFYYKCAADEKLVNGVCTDNTPTSGIWKWSEQSSYLDCSKNHTHHSHTSGEWSINFKETWGKYDEITAKGSYTKPPSYLKPDVAVPFTTSVTTTTTAEDGQGAGYETLVYFRTTYEYPLDETGDLDYNKPAGDHGTIVRAQSWGNSSDTQTENLILPKEGWMGWARYVTLSMGGGTVTPTGCTMRIYNVYVWQD